MTHVPPDDVEQALRLQRMASVHQRMVQPTGAELAAKWQARQTQQTPQTPSTPSSPLAAGGPVMSVAAGLVIGGILAAGVSALLGGSLLGGAHEPKSPPAAPSMATPQSLTPPAAPAQSSEPSSVPVVRVDDLPLDETNASHRMPSGSATSAAPAAPEDTTQRWRVVATALRENDTARAREVLSKLSKSADPSTRDAAALARAQLDVADGKLSSARAVFERVARQGTTSQLRAQAQRSLRQLEAKGE